MSLRGLNKTILVAAAISAASPVFAAQTKADYLFEVSGFGITNSMLTTWIFAIIIIALFRAMLCGGAKLVPSKGQLVIEAIVENLRSIMEPLLGKKAFKGAFPLLLGFFAYILIMNWSGLLPGVGSIGMEQIASGTECPEGFVPKEGAVNEYVKFVPFIRPADTDLNTTLALAIISFAAWIYFVLRYAGLRAFLNETFGNKADKNEIALPIYLGLFVIFFAVGCIDLISILMRLISLSFRLFGNTFGGEILLENMHHMAISLPRFVSWVIPIPFYLLEMLIGLIQAFLFSLLTAVYIGLITNTEGEE